MLLYGKPVAQAIEQSVREYIVTHQLQDKYVLLLLLNNTQPSRVYVTLKVDAAKRMGIQTKVINDSTLSVEQLLEQIDYANHDNSCCGIVVQLPLADHLVAHKETILTRIAPDKDIDGLNYQQSHILPATPRAVLELLAYYDFDDFTNQCVAVIGQSSLIGRPLSDELVRLGAKVMRYDIANTPGEIQQGCRDADILISATGSLHMIDQTYLSDSGDQIVVDVGRGILDGKAVGDVQRKVIQDHVHAVTPVPGGIGPVTVACLFQNICRLTS